MIAGETQGERLTGRRNLLREQVFGQCVFDRGDRDVLMRIQCYDQPPAFWLEPFQPHEIVIGKLSRKRAR